MMRMFSRTTLSRMLDGVDGVVSHVADRAADAARVIKFAKERARFIPRTDDLFVASYPRSGTTWTQFILYLLTSDGDLGFHHLSEVSPWWERSFATGSATAEAFEALPSPRIFKTHLPYRWLPRAGRIVYLIRDGRDVAVSYYHLHRSHLRFDGSFEQFFERFLSGEVQYRSWFKHVAGWERQRDNPRVMFLHYEDMHRDLPGAIARLAAFAGITASRKRVAEIAARSSFEAMKAHEDKFDHIGELVRQRGIQPGAFLRRGQVGKGDTYLTEAQRQQFADLAARNVAHPDHEWRLAAFLH